MLSFSTIFKSVKGILLIETERKPFCSERSVVLKLDEQTSTRDSRTLKTNRTMIRRDGTEADFTHPVLHQISHRFTTNYGLTYDPQTDASVCRTPSHNKGNRFIHGLQASSSTIFIFCTMCNEPV